MKFHLLAATAALTLASAVLAAPVLAPPPALGDDVQPFVRIPAGHIALAHVRVIDGTGAAALEDRTVLINGARIAAVQPGSEGVPAGYQTLDLAGASVIPG